MTKTNPFLRGNMGAKERCWKSLLPSEGGLLGYLFITDFKNCWLFLVFLKTEPSRHNEDNKECPIL